MLEERVYALEAALREMNELGIVRDALAKKKAEDEKVAKAASDKAIKDAEASKAKALAASQAEAIAAAKREGREPPSYGSPNATPQSN